MLLEWESYIDTYTKYLMKRGHECVKYIPSRKVSSVNTLTHALGHKVVRVPIGKHSPLGRDASRFLDVVNQLNVKTPASVVHFSTYYSRFFAATALTRLTGRVVTEYTGGELPQNSMQRIEWVFMLKRALGRASGVLVSDLSELDKKEAEILVDTLKVNRSKIFSFPVVAVDESMFYERDRLDSARELHFDMRKMNVLVVSGMTRGNPRLGPTKDPMLILRMFAGMEGQGDWHLHFVGFGPAYKEMIEEVQRTNLASKVTFHGLVPHGELPRYYSASELVVYPFPQYDLQSGTAVSEALACGRPVVCFKKDSSLPTELPGGYLINTDLSSASTELQTIVSHRKRLREKGREGIPLAEQFLLRNVGPRLEEIYRAINAE